ncbi:MAG: PspC domain-containing protein [Treponema sp.]
MDKKRLCKSNDKMILGVCSGIADFLNVDRTVIRLCAVLLTILGILPGILVYIIFAIIMPPPELSDEDVSKLKDAKISAEEDAYKANDVNIPPHSDEEFDEKFK